MAEVALTSIAKSALQLFTSLAKDEFLLQWNSQKELERLEDTFETITCFLQDADKLQSKELSVQKCLSRLREVMYDADDFFDALAAKTLHEKTITGNAFKKEVQLFFSKSSNQLGLSFKIAHKVKAFRESLDDIRADMVLCGFLKQPPPVGNQQVIRSNRHRTHSFVHEEDVIGRDQDRDHIIDMLLPQGEGESTFDGFSVVAIIGFGGLGKTTLAQYVYNNDKVKKGFNVCLWACINDLSNLEQVLIEIIASKEGGHHNLGLEMLQAKLREIIGGRKFLVALDDVWDENNENWRRLENILRCGNKGSKVLVTTRSVKVAECLDAQKSCCVDLSVLSDESAWSLFVKKAFCKGELSEYPELDPLGKKIVGRCGNVPLAIIVVGSLLRHRKKEERTWSGFLDNELGKALINSDGDRSHNSIKDVLIVSYNALLPNLKLCFAYCSLFPKDHRFDKDELVRLWLAQGFIKPSAYNEQCLEELGEEYFFHLVDRCFFQEVKEHSYKDDPNSLVVDNRLYRHTAKMHDLLHDVAIDVAKTENILLNKVSIKKGKRDSLRHISISPWVDDFSVCCSLVYDPKSIRTLLFHRRHNSGSSLNMSMLASFRMLRTLNLQDRGIVSLLDSIGELIHLRYLDLSRNKDLRHLPNSICKLHHLMTLVLQDCKRLEKLPQKIEKLASLRQLYIAGCDRLDCLPRGLRTLTSLVHLDRLIVHRDSGGLGYLDVLDNLRGVLRIELPEEGWPNAIEDAKGSNMSKKNKLDGMVIHWKGKGSNTEAEAILAALEPHRRLEHLEIRNYGGEKLSSWFCTLKNVKKLVLYGCEHVEYLEDEMKGNLCFPSLVTLKLERMKNLKGWWSKEIPKEIERPCLAKVVQVTIRDCPELKGQMPLFDGIEYLDLRDFDVKLVEELLITKPNCSSPSSLSPLVKLKELRLYFIKGLICLPEGWIRRLTALQKLEVILCRDLRWVSRRGLAHLTTLKHLEIWNYGGEKLSSWFCTLKNVKKLVLYGCEHVEYLEDEMKGNLCFPFLETLELEQMKNLKGWWSKEIPKEIERPCLAKVVQVTIRACPQLKGQMPLFDGIEYLDLHNVDVKLVAELLITKPNCSSPSSLSPLVKLKELRLSFIKGLICLREGWIRHLTALQKLDVIFCGDLRWVSRRGLAHLTTLKQLRWITCKCCNCPGIGDEDDDDKLIDIEVGMPWKALKGLEDLALPVGDRHFREGLGYLTFLKHLEIQKWEDEEDVELASKALQSLRSLRIGFDGDKTCDLRKTGIQYLSHSLTRLSVEGCKELYLGWKTLLITMKLEQLTFRYVKSVIDVEDMVVEQQSQLRRLAIHAPGGAKWVHDIPWKSLASSLISLHLEEIGEMEELPDGIQHLTSLRSLFIMGCEKVRSVPKWFPHLTSLTRLEIRYCSKELKRRCEKEKGMDWPLIRHIVC